MARNNRNGGATWREKAKFPDAEAQGPDIGKARPGGRRGRGGGAGHDGDGPAVGACPPLDDGESSVGYLVIRQGDREDWPVSLARVDRLRQKPWDVRFEAVLSCIYVREGGGATPQEIRFEKFGKDRSQDLEALRVFAEHPGEALTERLINEYAILPIRDLPHRVHQIRRLLGDSAEKQHFIRTVPVDRSVSRTGYGYMARGDLWWLVVRYWPSK